MKRGILIAVLVIITVLILLVAAGGLIYLQLTREPHISNNAALVIDLKGLIVDDSGPKISQNQSIRELWYHINRAKIDPRIQGILLDLGYFQAGFAKIQEIADILTDFRASGKKVSAFIEGGGLGTYLLSTYADNTVLFEAHNLFLKGLATEAIFLEDVFKNFGVQAQIYHIGKYKSAAYTYTRDRMVQEQREDLEKLLGDIYTSTISDIARNRKIPEPLVKETLSESPIDNRVYLQRRFVDMIGHRDQAMAYLGGLKEVPFSTYRETTNPEPFPGEKRIAVLFASGEIRGGTSGSNPFFGGQILGSDSLAFILRQLRRMSTVKGVVLRIDSPGGDAVASEIMRREIELLAKEKPVVVSMGDVAASGGYWISLAAGEIYAQPQTVTGSIGVISGKFVIRDLYNRIGITKDFVKTTPFADIFTDYRPFNPDEEAKIVAMMDGFYHQFVDLVAKARGLDDKQVDEDLARGRVWTGNLAQGVKLVDHMGGLAESINRVKELAGLGDEPTGVLLFPQKQTMLDVVLSFLTHGATSSPQLLTPPFNLLKDEIRSYQRMFPAARLPFQLVIE